MIKYEQRRVLGDWHGFEAAAAPLLNALGLHFATDGYAGAAEKVKISSRGGISRVRNILTILLML